MFGSFAQLITNLVGQSVHEGGRIIVNDVCDQEIEMIVAQLAKKYN
jgi:hypothetical protein